MDKPSSRGKTPQKRKGRAYSQKRTNQEDRSEQSCKRKIMKKDYSNREKESTLLSFNSTNVMERSFLSNQDNDEGESAHNYTDGFEKNDNQYQKEATNKQNTTLSKESDDGRVTQEAPFILRKSTRNIIKLKTTRVSKEENPTCMPGRQKLNSSGTIKSSVNTTTSNTEKTLELKKGLVKNYVHSVDTSKLGWKVKANELKKEKLQYQADLLTRRDVVLKNIKDPTWRKALFKRSKELDLVPTVKAILVNNIHDKDIFELMKLKKAKKKLKKTGAVLFKSADRSYVPCNIPTLTWNKIKLNDVTHHYIQRLGNCSWVFHNQQAPHANPALETIGDFFKSDREYTWYKDLSNKEIEQLSWEWLRTFVNESDGEYGSSYAKDISMSLMNNYVSKLTHNLMVDQSRYIAAKWAIAVLGVTTAMLYLGDIWTWFLPHIEDGAMFSTNTLLKGGCKIWYIVPPAYLKILEEKLNKFLEPQLNDPDSILHFKCKVPLRHKMLMVDLRWYVKNKIPIYRFVQHEGETIAINPSALHFGLNCSVNLAEATNHCQGPLDVDWMRWHAFTTYCSSHEQYTHVELEPYVYEFLHAKYNAYLHGNLTLINPYTDKEERVSSPGFRHHSAFEDNMASGVSEIVAVKRINLEDLHPDEKESYEFDPAIDALYRNEEFLKNQGQNVKIRDLVYVKMGDFAGWDIREKVETLFWNCGCGQKVVIPEELFLTDNSKPLVPFGCPNPHQPELSSSSADIGYKRHVRKQILWKKQLSNHVKIVRSGTSSIDRVTHADVRRFTCDICKAKQKTYWGHQAHKKKCTVKKPLGTRPKFPVGNKFGGRPKMNVPSNKKTQNPLFQVADGNLYKNKERQILLQAKRCGATKEIAGFHRANKLGKQRQSKSYKRIIQLEISSDDDEEELHSNVWNHEDENELNNSSGTEEEDNVALGADYNQQKRRDAFESDKEVNEMDRESGMEDEDCDDHLSNDADNHLQMAAGKINEERQEIDTGSGDDDGNKETCTYIYDDDKVVELSENESCHAEESDCDSSEYSNDYLTD